MGKGSSQPAQTTSTQSPNPQIAAEYQALVNRATGIANTPYQPFQGEMIAPLTNQTLSGLANVNQYAYAAQPWIQQAGQLTSGASAPVTAQPWSAEQINQYMNPFTQNVVNATQREFNNQNQQQAEFLNSANISSGAFGGDRAGIGQAILANQQQLAQAPIIANLNQGNYQQAQNEFNTQQALKAQLGLANAGIGLQAGQQLGNLGQLSQTTGLQGATAQAQAGAIPQQQQQAIDTAIQNAWATGQAYPYQSTGWLGNIIEGIGSQMGGQGTTTSPGPSSTSQTMGAITSGLGLLGSLISDERLKENVQKVGETFDRQPIYRFNYKGDPRTQIGLMAQDEEKHTPQAVHRGLGGMKMLDYRKATDEATRRGHFQVGGPAYSEPALPSSAQLTPRDALAMMGNRGAMTGMSPVDLARSAYTPQGLIFNRPGFQGGGGMGGMASYLASLNVPNSPPPVPGSVYVPASTYSFVDFWTPTAIGSGVGAPSALSGVAPIEYYGVTAGGSKAKGSEAGFNPGGWLTPLHPTEVPLSPWEQAAQSAYQGYDLSGLAQAVPGSVSTPAAAPALPKGRGFGGRARRQSGGILPAYGAPGWSSSIPGGVTPSTQGHNDIFAAMMPRSAPDNSQVPVMGYTGKSMGIIGVTEPNFGPSPLAAQERGGRVSRAAGGQLGQTGLHHAIAYTPQAHGVTGKTASGEGLGSIAHAHSLFGDAFGSGRRSFQGGGVPDYPWANVPGYVPSSGPLRVGGNTMPKPPSPAGGGGGSGLGDLSSLGKNLGSLGKQVGSLFSGSGSMASDIGSLASDASFMSNADSALSGGLDFSGIDSMLLAYGGRPHRQDGGDIGTDVASLEEGVDTSLMDPANAPMMDADALAGFKNRIGQIESGGHPDPYSVTGPTVINRHGQDFADQAIGRYQVMGANVPSWTQKILGFAMTPEQFRNSPAAQERVASGIMGPDVARLGPANAASIWFTGRPLAQGANLHDVLGTSGAKYARLATTLPLRGMSGDRAIPPVPFANLYRDSPVPVVPVPHQGSFAFPNTPMGPNQSSDVGDVMAAAWRGGMPRRHFDTGGDADSSAAIASPPSWTRQDVLDMTKNYAESRGIDPKVPMFIVGHEMGQNEPYQVGDDGSSFSPWQLHKGGISDKYPHSGLGDTFQAMTGLDPNDPQNLPAVTRFSVDYIARHGPGAWSTAKLLPGQGGGGSTEGGASYANAPSQHAEETQGYLPPGQFPGQPQSQDFLTNLRQKMGDIGPAMMMAGFGMMAGRSPWAGVNIGQGAMAGMEYYQKQRQLDRQYALTQAQINNLSSEAWARGAGIGLASQKLDLERQMLSLRFKGLAANQALYGGQPEPTAATPSQVPATAAPIPTVSSPSPQPPPKAPISNTEAIARAGDIPTQGVMPGGITAPRPDMAPTGTVPPTLAPAQAQTPDDPWSHVPMGEQNPAWWRRKAQADLYLDPTGAQSRADMEYASKLETDTMAVQDAQGNEHTVLRIPWLHGYRPGEPASQVQAAPVIHPIAPEAAAAELPPGMAVPGEAAPPGGDITKISPQLQAYRNARAGQIAKGEETMAQQYQQRQLVENQLHTVMDIMQTYQPGALAEEKSDVIRKLRAVGVPVDKIAQNLGINLDTAKPEQFQKFFKESKRIVFDNVKNLGGRFLLATVKGMEQANVSPEMEPDAAASIATQALGFSNYEDAKFHDYLAAKAAANNRGQVFDPMNFIVDWTSRHDPQTYVDSVQKPFAYLGQTNRVPGQTYMWRGKPRVWVSRPGSPGQPPQQGWADLPAGRTQ